MIIVNAAAIHRKEALFVHGRFIVKGGDATVSGAGGQVGLLLILGLVAAAYLATAANFHPIIQVERLGIGQTGGGSFGLTGGVGGRIGLPGILRAFGLLQGCAGFGLGVGVGYTGGGNVGLGSGTGGRI